MTSMKKFGALVIGMMALTATANAQDKVEASISADVVSKYVWRGMNCDDASIQPSLGVSYKGLSLTAWGSYGVTQKESFHEFDLTLAYSTGDFHVGVTDYWNNGWDTKKYFSYGSGPATTAHTYEANLGYDFGVLSVDWYTNFAGLDGVTESGKRAYTSYFELNAPFSLGGVDWNATLGAIPYNSNGGYYADVNSKGFAVTNISLKATKNLKINDNFSIPVFAQIATNPSVQKAYFVLGLSIQP